MIKFLEYLKFYKIDKTIINKISDEDKVLLIMRTDLIGDYLATRHLIRILKSSYQYKGYKFVLLVNEFLKDIAMEFDSKYIDEFIWFDRNKMSNKLYRMILKKILNKRQYDVLINSQYSRDYVVEEIAKVVNSKEKICVNGDNYNICEYSKLKYDKLYTKIVKLPKERGIYLKRTNQLLEALTGEKQNLIRPVLELKEEKFKSIDFDWTISYVVMFPFARTSERVFKLENYLKLAQYIFEKHNIITYICGSRNESKHLKDVKLSFIKNICGKYLLSELPYIFSKARLVMTNDTMALHIAGGVNENVFCFSNGKFIVDKSLHYEEVDGEKLYYFDEPYKGIKTICPQCLYNDILNGTYDYDSNYFESSYDINGIDLEKTKKFVDIVLNKDKKNKE